MSMCIRTRSGPDPEIRIRVGATTVYQVHATAVTCGAIR